MFDINKVEAEAKAELAKEQGEKAKAKIKAKLKQIEDAKRILANLQGEYDVLLSDIGSE